MKRRRLLAVSTTVAVVVAAMMGTASRASALPAGNTVAQWNKIAEDTVVGSGAFQNEGLVYMAYVSAAVYDAVVAIEGGYAPYGPGVSAPAGASADCAVVEAAYRTLSYYFASKPALLTALDSYYSEALAGLGGCTSDGGKGTAVGLAAFNLIRSMRDGDGRLTPIATTSSFPTKAPGPSVWRLTPAPFAAPQTPWVADVTPFVLDHADRFLPPPPPSLSSPLWVEGFNEIKRYGQSGSVDRTPDETATALFWTANVIRQYNLAARDLAAAEALSRLETARLAAMVNLVGADAQISVMNAKYHYLFWRPVSAIDPTAVKPSPGDGFGPTPGYDDSNPATVEAVGWRPLITTPNHPEYPAAHGSITSAMAEVFSDYLGTNHFDLMIHGFDPSGEAGNLNAQRLFDKPNELRREIVNARLWAGVHYRFSGTAGVVLGRQVAKFDLRNAFQPVP